MVSLPVKIGRRIFAYYALFAFAIIFLILYPIFAYLLSNERSYYRANQLRVLWGKLALMASGKSYQIAYEMELDPDQQYVVCANHSSVIDIPLSAIILQKRNYKFMGKMALAEIPLFGIFFRTVDIPVYRESKISSYRAFVKAKEAIENGYDLIIYPEGTTSNDAPQMLPFKNGPFKIAIEEQIPILPVTFLNNWDLFLYDGSMLCKPGTAVAIVHQPIETRGMSMDDVEQLKTRVYNTIDQRLKQDYESRFAIG